MALKLAFPCVFRVAFLGLVLYAFFVTFVTGTSYAMLVLEGSLRVIPESPWDDLEVVVLLRHSFDIG